MKFPLIRRDGSLASRKIARGVLFLFLILAGTAHAMEFEVRVPFVVMSGSVTGMELRELKSVLEKNLGITTVVLKNSHGGDAATGYAVGEFIRERGLNTALSGYCISSCSRMFLGGKERQYSDDQSLENTFVGLHGNYGNDGSLLVGRMEMLTEWIVKYSDGKANLSLVDQWVHIKNHHGYAAFYHRDARLLPGTQKVLLCQGTEERGKRQEQCEKPALGDALDNGIVTSWDVLPVRGRGRQFPSSGYAAIGDINKVPLDNENGIIEYKRYLAFPSPKAFAVSVTRQSWAWNGGGSEDVNGLALKRCEERAKQPCVLYGVDDNVVYKTESANQ
jgi:hypothetical protein